MPDSYKSWGNCSLGSLLVLPSGDVMTNPGPSHYTGDVPTFLQRPCLKTAHLNIRSLLKHLDELKILLLDHPFDIICLNETWLNSSWTDNELVMDGYNLVRYDPPDEQRGGGVAIYYKSKFNVRPRPDIPTHGFETVWIQINFPNKSKLLVSSLYRPPNVDPNNFIPNLEKTLDVASSKGDEILLLGDLNYDLSSEKLPHDTKEVIKLFNIYQFSQLIEDPTRITETSKTLIDVAFTTNADKIATSGVLNCSISDHQLVYIVRPAKFLRGEIKTVRCRRFNNYSSQNFADDLHSASWENIDTSLTVNDAWMAFKRTFMDIADKHAPFMTMRIRSSTLPWLNKNIRNLIKERNFHHKKAQKSGSCNDWATYRAIRNQVVSQIPKA